MLRFSKKDLLPLVFLTALSVFFFKDILIEQHYLFGSDFVGFYLALKQFLYNEIHAYHTIPFWNPYVFAGIPFWAHFESTIFYPLDMLFFFVSPEKAYGYTMFFHLLLAGSFMYIFTRSLGLKRAPSFLASTAYAFNGLIMPTLFDGQMFRVQAYIWLPLILLFLNRALMVNLFPNAVLAGLFWGIQLLSGSPQDGFYTFLAGSLFLICHFVPKFRQAGPFHFKMIVLSLALFFFFGVGLASIQLFPAYEFIKLSVRSVLNTYDLASPGSYPPQGIITSIMPNFFGEYYAREFWLSDTPWSIPLYNLYIGVVPLVFLPFVTFHRHRRLVIFSLILTVVSFVLALGSHSSIYKLFYVLPGFNSIRAPAKILILWVFSLSLLGAKGMDDLFNYKARSSMPNRLLLMSFLALCFLAIGVFLYFDNSAATKIFSPFITSHAIPSKMAWASTLMSAEFHRFAVFFALTMLILFLWFHRSVKYIYATSLLCALLSLDLAWVNGNAVQHKDDIYQWAARVEKNLSKVLKKNDTVFRVGSREHGMGPNLEMYLGYQTVGGYTPLFLFRYSQYIDKYTGGRLPKGWIVYFYDNYGQSVLMDLLNVEYEIDYEKGRIIIIPRKSALPRAFLVPAHKLSKEQEILDFLVKPCFDPRQTVILEAGVSPQNLLKTQEITSHVDGQVNILHYRPDRIVLKSESSHARYLFLSEVYYPGWKAYVDDAPTPILRGNFLFRVIKVPPGRHIVRFSFEPFSIKIGVCITIATLVTGLAIILLTGSRRNARKSNPYM
jgi:hypothetical protein